MDKEYLKNYCLIYHLPFIVKFIEKIVAWRTEEHLEPNDHNAIYQSAYNRGNWAETDILNVCSDTALIVFDLSADFDVIDHPLLLKRFEFSFCVKEKALIGVKS